jgi:hypothetical protein
LSTTRVAAAAFRAANGGSKIAAHAPDAPNLPETCRRRHQRITRACGVRMTFSAVRKMEALSLKETDRILRTISDA